MQPSAIYAVRYIMDRMMSLGAHQQRFTCEPPLLLMMLSQSQSLRLLMSVIRVAYVIIAA
jgi:hypothetical protein